MKYSVSFIAIVALIFSGTALRGQEVRGDSVGADVDWDARSFSMPTEKAVDLQNALDFPHHVNDSTSLFNAPSSNRLDFAGKASYFARHSFGPGAFIGALFAAAPELAKPPAGYPQQWRNGAGAFGRLYGDALAFQTAAQTGKFLTGAMFHEDPRYFPSSSLSPLARVMHAIVFTAFDKSDSGHTRLALSNFAASASAGFVGNAYLPRGYNDTNHGVSRMSIEFGSLAVTNIAQEFTPDLRRLGKKLQLPRFILPIGSSR